MGFWRDQAFLLLILIFLLALLIRFLYFPNNVYFGYDQARDFYGALEILHGHLKLIGPPSSINSVLFHGPLIYYIYAPILFLFNKSPEAVSLVFRVINALGIFLSFWISRIIFNKWLGIISAFLFAISFEQSQYSIFLQHPSLAAVTVLIFYLGLSLVIFKEKAWGLPLAVVGLGLSIQFHYVNGYLIVPMAVMVCLFRQRFRLNLKTYFYSVMLFLLTISSFILAELKFHAREVAVLTSNQFQLKMDLSQIGIITQRAIHDNLVSNFVWIVLVSLVVGLVFDFTKGFRQQFIFLLVWFISGLIPYLISSSPSYYYNAGSSLSLILLTAFLLFQLWQRIPALAGLLLLVITFSNLNLVMAENSKGPNLNFVIQPQMLTSSEKQVLDYIYQTAAEARHTKTDQGSDSDNLAVSGLTVPLEVNTTWSYLFGWYGKSMYGYVPIWFGPTAAGFPGNLKVESARGQLPKYQFIIIEPTVGIDQGQIDNFFKEESYFTKVIQEKQFGTIKVQLRQRI